MKVRYRIAIVLALIIGLEACLVIAGWVFGVEALTHIIPSGINMKFPTALIFLLAALALFLIARVVKANSDIARTILPGVALVIFLVMTSLLASGLSGVPTGLDSFFVEEQGSVSTLATGMPSLFTAFGFILFGLACLYLLLIDSKQYTRLQFFGYPIASIGLVAIVGYIVHLPALYFQFNGTAIPMAFNTAAAFVLLGSGLIALSITKANHEA